MSLTSAPSSLNPRVEPAGQTVRAPPAAGWIRKRSQALILQPETTISKPHPSATPWFQRLCRQAGLAVHRVAGVSEESAESEKGDIEGVETTQVTRKVEEVRVSPTVVLRRTTVEEVEVRAEPLQSPLSGRGDSGPT